MKNFIYSFLALTFILFTACEGPQGPPGPPGFDGIDGDQIVSSAFEIAVDFNRDNDFQFVEPYGFEVFPSDVTLVYILWEVDGGQDVWRLLPQSVTFEDSSQLVYNFDFTDTDVSFFLDGTTNFDTLGPEWTDGQVFRVVVVPADNVDGLDISDFSVLSDAFNISDFETR